MKKNRILIMCMLAAQCLVAENIAPPVPRDTDVDNGHTMQTDVRIDVDDDIEKIVVKQIVNN